MDRSIPPSMITKRHPRRQQNSVAVVTGHGEPCLDGQNSGGRAHQDYSTMRMAMGVSGRSIQRLRAHPRLEPRPVRAFSEEVCMRTLFTLNHIFNEL